MTVIVDHAGKRSLVEVGRPGRFTGRLLDAIDQLGIADNTIFIFTSDNGPEMFLPNIGSSGPWRGTYFTGLEGSLRVPFIVRWPGKVPAGAVSDEIVHQMDVFPTLAGFTGAEVPKDRIIDGVDQGEFLLGKSAKSGREGFVVYVGNEIYGIKWRNWPIFIPIRTIRTAAASLRSWMKF